jgi:hypothetical protein
MKPSVQRLLTQPVSRRSFFRSLGSAAAGLGALGLLTDEEIEGAVRNVQRNSVPPQLRITDLRVAVVTGARVMHPFTGIEITDRGVEILSNYIGEIRSVIGMEVPLSSDHYGHISVNSCIKLARAMEKHNLAWMEDMLAVRRTDEADQGCDNHADPDGRGHLPQGRFHEADQYGRASVHAHRFLNLKSQV